MLILVTGATGSVGRHVTTRLLEAGVDVRALTRDPARAGLPQQVKVCRGDLTEPGTVRHALRGVERLYLFPVPETAAEIVRMARDQGISRIVVLSSVSAAYDDEGFSGDHHRAVEAAVEASGIAWTHVRPGEFMTNLLDWAPAVASEGVVRAPFADQESNAVHEADIADVAAAALLEDGHEGRAYEVNGSETLTRAEQARTIGEAIGRDIRFEELTRAQAREHWITDGMDSEVADWLLGPEEGDEPNGNQDCNEGEIHDPESTAEVVTGEPARTLAQWARDHRSVFETIF